ncbi:hypothetical protein OB905_00945 [Halobacteria archaeon AArc-dxtr1]|nr:hypothetical protein [Halobacteria archaeon AArc-dxtr1]
MDPSLLFAGFTLLVGICGGLLVHEWSHALVLRLARIEYAVRILPGRDDGVLSLVMSCPWAVVEPRLTGREAPWILRCAALAPLTLLLPVALAIGVGGFRADHPVYTAAVVGWVACALPSPQDFSVVFYAHRLIDEHAETVPTELTRPSGGEQAP